MSDLHRVFVDNGEGVLPGVPRRSLTKEEYDALPGWLQNSVDASPNYRKAPSAPTKQEAPEPAGEDES